MHHQTPIHTFRSFRQPEASAHVHKYGGHNEADQKRPILGPDDLARLLQEYDKQDEIDEEAGNLECQTREQNIIGSPRAFPIRFGTTDQGGTNDLDDRGDNVARDEESNYAARRE